jgi:hypothetical protein
MGRASEEADTMKRRLFHAAILALAAPSLAAPGRGRAQSGFQPMFNGRDLSGWEPIGNANWRWEDGAVVADRGVGFLVSTREYANFRLRTEFFAETHTNSGIFIRATNPTTVNAANSYEVNIWDERPEPRFGTGAIVDIAAVDPMPRAGGRWNSFDITANGEVLTVVLNGQTTVPGVRSNRHARGRIALQHAASVPGADGQPNDRGVIRFRNLEIQVL